MRLSDAQIRTTLRELRDHEPDARRRTVPLSIELLSAEVLAHLAELPTVRADRVAAGRARLVDGHAPSSDDLARKLVGRLVCDRLR